MSVVVLATALVIGTTTVLGATSYSWEVTYRDGVRVIYSTVEPRLDFNARSGQCFTAVTCAEPEHSCSAPSYEVCADPLIGDTAPFDGIVGLSDYLAVGSHWGESAP